MNAGIVLIKEKRVDDVPKNYLTYKQLVNALKEQIPNLKLNKEFHKKKKEIVESNSNMIHIRKLDPNNPKSTKKDFYNPNIIDEFKKTYNVK